MYTTPVKHSWIINVLHKAETPSGSPEQYPQILDFLDSQMQITSIQSKVVSDFSKLLETFQSDVANLDQIHDPFKLAKLSLRSTNPNFANAAREKFLSMTGGDQAYLDQLKDIEHRFSREKNAILAQSTFRSQAENILSPQA